MKTPISTIIVDDEIRSRSILRTMLSRFCDDIELVGEAANIDEAIQLIRATAPSNSISRHRAWSGNRV